MMYWSKRLFKKSVMDSEVCVSSNKDTIDICFQGSLAEWWLPAFDVLGQRSKDWIFEKGRCGKCKERFSKYIPHCSCPKITKVDFPNSCCTEDYLGGIYPYERRREYSKYARDYYKDRKEKAEGHHTKKDIDAIYELQGGLCYYCLTKITYNSPKRDFDADHIKPLAQGGTNWPYNIAAACRKCNQSKGALGGLAFWNKLDKKLGSKIVSKAKQLSKEQRPQKKKISEYRKLKTNKN